MNKIKIIVICAVIILVGGGIFFLIGRMVKAPAIPTASQEQTAFDPKNATYNIDGNTYTLVNGVSEVEAAPGSASKITTRYFGNDSTGDLNGDGIPDVAFLITQDGGGSGIFYYVVAVLKTETGYKITNATFIGDRIAPQTTQIIGQELVVNYAERKSGEPMTTQPSVGVSRYFKVTPDNQLLEITM